MKKFIYVFDQSARDTLLSIGYQLVKSDETQKVYIFENVERFNFSLQEMSYVLSDTLTF